MTMSFGSGSGPGARRGPPAPPGTHPPGGSAQGGCIVQPRIVREPQNAAAATRIRIYVLTKVGGRRARVPKLVLPPRRPPRLMRVFACLLVSLWPLGVFLAGAHTRSRPKLRARYVAYRTAAAVLLDSRLNPCAARPVSTHQALTASAHKKFAVLAGATATQL